VKDTAWVVVAIIGGLLFLDGVASILVQGGQYHEFWFDLERGVRALAGAVLVGLGAWRLSRA
jgi:hypothetical protein